MGWTTGKLLEWSVDMLTKAGVGAPHLDAEILLAEATRSSRQEILLQPGRAIRPQELGKQRALLNRRASHEPIAYIVGRREFWSLDFKVSPDVLVPRPETELVVECLLKAAAPLKVSNGKVLILDLGTGSGNLAVVAAKEIPQSRVVAVDNSPGALAVARENAALHGVKDSIQFLESDLFKNVPEEEYDFIISNPPYIPAAQIPQLMPDVKDYEPRRAIDGGPEGLSFYHRIVPLSVIRLKAGGALILEIGDEQGQAVCRIIEAHGGYGTPSLTQDYCGRDRVVVVRKKHGQDRY